MYFLEVAEIQESLVAAGWEADLELIANKKPIDGLTVAQLAWTFEPDREHNVGSLASWLDCESLLIQWLETSPSADDIQLAATSSTQGRHWDLLAHLLDAGARFDVIDKYGHQPLLFDAVGDENSLPLFRPIMQSLDPKSDLMVDTLGVAVFIGSLAWITELVDHGTAFTPHSILSAAQAVNVNKSVKVAIEEVDAGRATLILRSGDQYCYMVAKQSSDFDGLDPDSGIAPFHDRSTIEWLNKTLAESGQHCPE